MAYVSDDRNYTDPGQSGRDATGRVGDFTGEAPDNEAINRKEAAKMANLLEGLEFPATKEDIKNHINRKSPSMGNRINDVIEAVQNNPQDGESYANVYEVEKAAGLVREPGQYNRRYH
jgi:hypothetical protein